eukprot:572625-Rhodomonas_salina.2
MVSSSNSLARPSQRIVLAKRSARPTARIEVQKHYHRIPHLIGISYEARARSLSPYSYSYKPLQSLISPNGYFAVEGQQITAGKSLMLSH